ncbi:MAG: Hsp20/alpha crystallin family protein [Candidatus Ventricola sp.]|nr:Hsp20/alpha crystallin family protein [Clostridiales bacterium]MDY3832327.1 Hsp20/alpha crystallin family protein [Candidatus Ventricola sp.]
MSNYLPTVFGENLMDVFDDFDRSFFRGFGNVDHALYGKHAQHMMKTDVKELEDSYEVDIDLPGFKKDEIHLELNNGYLTISTEKTLEKDNEGKKGKMLRQERYSGVMQRSFFVGEHLTEEDIKASYDSGVLHVIIPKKDAPKAPEKKTILIEG